MQQLSNMKSYMWYAGRALQVALRRLLLAVGAAYSG